MSKYFILAFSSHLLGVFGSRAGDLLDTCCWVNDENPNDGTYSGIYAINLDDPAAFCNSYQLYDENLDSFTYSDDGGGPSFSIMSWYYEYNQTTGAIDKYMCLNDATCSGPCFLRNEITDPSYYNCDDTLTEDCSMAYSTYVNNDATGGCDADMSKVARTTYGVNGGCVNMTDDEGELYALFSCNDWLVLDDAGDSHGISIEYYQDENCMWKIEDRSIQEMTTGECSGPPFAVIYDRLSYMGEVDCNGWVNFSASDDGGDGGGIDLTNVNGMIDQLGDDCLVCTNPCLQQTAPANIACEVYGDYLFNGLGECSRTESDVTSWTETQFCPALKYQLMNIGINANCTDVGIPAFFDCVVANDCYGVIPDGYDDDGGDDCMMDCFPPCMNDTLCLTTVMNMDDAMNSSNSSVFSLFADICSDTQNDCTVLESFFGCAVACDSGDDDDFCPEMQAAMIPCIFDAGCGAAFVGITGGDLDSMCDDDECTPSYFTGIKDAYCASNPDNCNTKFDAFYDALFTCISSECMVLCGEEMNACFANETCAEELSYVMEIEDMFGIADNEAGFELVLASYCAERDAGECSSLLTATYACVKQNECIDYEATQCVSVNCEAEILACSANEVCARTFAQTSKNETECREQINWDCDCDDLPSECFQCVEPTCDTLDYCESECNECGESYLDSLENCLDGSCGPYGDLLVCRQENCVEVDEDADCFPDQCLVEIISCITTDGCKENVDWVLDNFGSWNSTQYPGGDGCSAADLTALEETVANTAEDSAEYAAAWAELYACAYADIINYCDDTSTNPDGCPFAVYPVVNCIFAQCFDVEDFTNPPTTPAPTTPAPTTAETTTVETTEGEEVTGTGIIGESEVDDNFDDGACEWNIMQSMVVCALLSYFIY